MTLFMDDGKDGLPCEQVFGDAVEQLRQSGRRVAKVGACV